MEPQRDKEEVYTHNNSVTPGYLYDKITKNFLPREDRETFKTTECPLKFNVSHMKIDILRKLSSDRVKNDWMLDFARENPEEAILVKGVKISEKRGVGIPRHKSKHTVTSVLYKVYAEMLITFSQNIPEEWTKELEVYLLAVLNESPESFIPNQILKYSKCVYIYHSFGTGRSGKQVDPNKHSFEEYCRILKASKVSTVPITTYIEDPESLHVRPVVTAIESLVENLGTTTAVTGKNNASQCSISSMSVKKDSISTQETVPWVHVNKGNVQREVEPRGRTVSGRGNGRNQWTGQAGPGTQAMKTTTTGRGRGTSQGRGRNDGVYTVGNTGDSVKFIPQGNSTFLSSSNGNTSISNDSLSIVESESMDEYGWSKTSFESYPYTQTQQSNDVFSAQETYASSVKRPENPSDEVYSRNSKVSEENRQILSTSVKDEEFSKSVQYGQRHSSTSEESGNMVYDVQSDVHNTQSNNTEDLLDVDVENLKMGLSQTGLEKDINLNVDDKENPSSEHNMEIEIDCKGTAIENSLLRSIYVKPENIQDCSIQTPMHDPKCKLQDTSKYTSKRNEQRDPKKDQKNGPSNANTALTHPLQYLSASDNGTKRKQTQNQGIDGNETIAPSSKTVKPITSKVKVRKSKSEELQIQMKSTFLNPEKTVNDPCGIERKYYGVLNDTCPEKVIIFLGASGSGKTMLINFIANYFMGKKSADEELIYVETTVPTSAITAYTFCSGQEDNPITIIDTPGLNDSSGAEVRDHVKSLKTFLANASSKGFEIHAIGFVAQAHLVRLTSSERLVMDYVSTMFGQSVSEHMITLVTFADTQDTPPVVEAMKNYGVNSKLFLKFNNSALSNTKSDEIDDLDRAYWRVCWRNWKKCLKTLRDLPALGVNTMKAVQSEIYAATVIESAERDLRGEIATFLTYCKKGKYISKEASQVCEQIWELAAIIHRMNYATTSAPCNIIVNFALDSCKTLSIIHEQYVSLLSLAPSGSLVISGSEIIRTMASFYTYARSRSSGSESISKNITEWSYCHTCAKEHKMKRHDTGKGWSLRSPPGPDVLCLKCEECKCPGATHGVSVVKSPLHFNNILQHTHRCLCNALTQHSLPGYTVQVKIFLQYLEQHLDSKHKDFIHDLLNMQKN